MINIEDLKLGNDVYVISQKRIGVVTGLKRKKKNPASYLVTVEYDDGSDFTTSLDNIDEPNYQKTPPEIMWSSLCDVLGEDFITREDNNKLANKVLTRFMEGMTKAGFIIKKEEKN